MNSGVDRWELDGLDVQGKRWLICEMVQKFTLEMNITMLWACCAFIL